MDQLANPWRVAQMYFPQTPPVQVWRRCLQLRATQRHDVIPGSTTVFPTHAHADSIEPMTVNSIGRQLILLALCVATACASLPAEKPGLLDRAIAAAGGQAALSRARRFVWAGDADVHAGGRDIALSVHSDIVPFGRVTSETWLRDKGVSSMRVMELDGATGWVTRDGKRERLPEAVVKNETVQFGTYDLLRLVSLRNAGVTSREIGADAQGLVGLSVTRPTLGQSTLWFDQAARLVALTNDVPSPEGNAAIHQRFEFSGVISSNGVRWPRELKIFQNGALFFELRLSEFTALPLE